MTPERQRIAIAEACGWKWETREHPAPCWHYGDYYVNAPLFYENRKKEDYLNDLPDYLNDLNAMHAGLEILTDNQKARYVIALCRVLDFNMDEAWNDHDVFEFAQATAAEQLEAFLRTIGKWEED